MKAYSLHGVGDLRYENVEYPKCPTGWSVIKVRAAGICSSDIPRIFTKGTYHFPTIPGHEFSGVVDKVADKENEHLLGKKVGIFPLIPCKRCKQCQTGHYEICENYDYVGSRRDGGFAEYVAVPVWNLIELDESIDFREAAMMEPLAVALHAVKQSGLKKGDSFAVIGTGMIAFAAAQWATKLGASSVAILGRTPSKKKLADRLPGVEYGVISDCVDEYDVVLEAVGTNHAIEKAIEYVRAGGTLVLMGNPEGNIEFEQNVYWRILRKQLNVRGTWNSSYDYEKACDWSEVREALTNRTIQASALISHTYHDDELVAGLMLMREHKESFCKVMTIWG